MKNIQVLGTGCRKCQTTVKYINEAAAALGTPIDLQKVEDIQDIVAMGVMTTPAVAIDGRIVHSGSVPLKSAIEDWLRN